MQGTQPNESFLSAVGAASKEVFGGVGAWMHRHPVVCAVVAFFAVGDPIYAFTPLKHGEAIVFGVVAAAISYRYFKYHRLPKDKDGVE